jgi:hypothetical protein
METYKSFATIIKLKCQFLIVIKTANRLHAPYMQ